MYWKMKRAMLVFALLLTGLVAWAQNITIDENVPQAAVEVLQPRLMQMLQAECISSGLVAVSPGKLLPRNLGWSATV